LSSTLNHTDTSCQEGHVLKRQSGNQLEASHSAKVTEIDEKGVGLTPKAQRKLLSQHPTSSPDQRLLKVAIIGAPNAGKSTLLNRLVGWKVAPVSQKVHTTRNKTLGVLTEDDKQVVFLDTPGIIVPGKMKRHNLELSLLVDPHAALAEADLVVVTVDVSHVWHRSRLDPEILKLLHLHADVASVLVLNKVDLIEPKQRLLSVVRKLTCGVVDNQKDSTTVKMPSKRIDLDALFAKTRAAAETHLRDRQMMDSSKSPNDKMAPEFLDIREICNRLQNSDTDDVNDNVLNVGHSADVVTTSVSHSEILTESISMPDCRNSAEVVNSWSAVSVNETQTEHYDRHIANEENVERVSSNFRLSRLHELTSDLYSPSVWNDYYQRLEKIGHDIKGQEGWPHFDAVFMVSALGGDGVCDLKNHLLDQTYRSPWLYASSLVTDQDPIKLAKSIIRERLLEHLPDEIPYCVQVKLSVWEIGEDNLLRAAFDIECSEPRHLYRILGQHGETVRRIAAEAKQELMNAFRREMTLKLVVHAAGGLDCSRSMAVRKPKKISISGIRQECDSRKANDAA
jgi:small GTP-binding protein